MRRSRGRRNNSMMTQGELNREYDELSRESLPIFIIYRDFPGFCFLNDQEDKNGQKNHTRKSIKAAE